MEGFWYNGKHSDDFHCYFIPDENDRWFASPDFEVYETTDTGKDGGYFYGTKAKVRAFTLKCFYEDATIQQREALRRWLDRNTSGQLIFDRRPFVHYDVRPTKVVQGKRWTSLAPGSDEELYNGTLTITFSAYQPYGILNYKEYTDFDTEGAALYCGMLEHSMMPTIPEDIPPIDFSSAHTKPYVISGVTGLWRYDAEDSSYFIPVDDGCTMLTVAANAEQPSVVALLKTATPSNGATPDYATGGTCVVIPAGQSHVFSIPSDCHYVCILKITSLDYGEIDGAKEISLADHIGDGTNRSSGSGGNYCVTIDELLSDLRTLPSANTVVAQDVEALPATLNIITGSYNAVFNAGVTTSTISRGIGVKTDGGLVVYIDGMKRLEMGTWLQENPVTIRYKIPQADYTPDSAVFVSPQTNTRMIYNCGTQTCSPIFRISGIADTGLVITNHTNDTYCRLTGFPSVGYLEIDGNLGSVTWVHGASRDLAFAYHTEGFVTLEPYMACEDEVVVSYTSGSTAITQPNGTFDDR